MCLFEMLLCHQFLAILGYKKAYWNVQDNLCLKLFLQLCFVIASVYVDVNNMNFPIIMCNIVGATILTNGIEFSIHKPG